MDLFGIISHMVYTILSLRQSMYPRERRNVDLSGISVIETPQPNK